MQKRKPQMKKLPAREKAEKEKAAREKLSLKLQKKRLKNLKKGN